MDATQKSRADSGGVEVAVKYPEIEVTVGNQESQGCGERRRSTVKPIADRKVAVIPANPATDYRGKAQRWYLKYCIEQKLPVEIMFTDGWQLQNVTLESFDFYTIIARHAEKTLVLFKESIRFIAVETSKVPEKIAKAEGPKCAQ